ncbi:MAG: hypothetical protein QGF74_02735 [Candidatus Nanoarchaeia archaeon]|jgi:hypothetical protein|nr:hypothetical protein [Candidatus Nanoarchaeia archaeon]|tara:strand:- start:9624 stop:10055 length:432 start_codon:yes stop_codon:yes gene_type:complete
MPDFKTHYATIMITLLFVLGFFWFLQNPRSLETDSGLEDITGMDISEILLDSITSSKEDNNEIMKNAERIVFDYLISNNIDGDIQKSSKEDELFRIEVDLFNSEFDVVFDLDSGGNIKCFQRFNDKKCYDNFDDLNIRFLSMS